MTTNQREKLRNELFEHLNNGCLDEHCDFESGYFNDGCIQHIIDIIEDTYETL
jgi:hypothetical protein